MKVLMCNSFFYIRGGSEAYVFELERLLKAHGHEIIDFCMQSEKNLPSEYSSWFVSEIDFPALLSGGDSPFFFLRNGFRVLERVIYSREAKTKLKDLIEQTEPDIVHLHNYAHHLSPSILDAIRQYDLPVVQTLHDYKLVCPATTLLSRGEICERCRGQRYYNVILRQCKRDAFGPSLLVAIETYAHAILGLYDGVDLFLSPSRFLREKIIEFGIEPDRVCYVPHYVIDPAEYPACYEPGRYFAYIGRLTAYKGLETLLQAALRLPNVELLVAGEGEYETEVHKFVVRDGMKNVRLLGYLSGQELRELVVNALAVVVPSEWYENSPAVIYEAFAFGKPVIGSDIGGIPELITDGQTGILVQPGDVSQLTAAMASMAANPHSVSEMGRAARSWLEAHHNPQQHYGAIMDVYTRLLERAQGPKRRRIV